VSESVDLSNPQRQCEPGPFGDRATVSINLLPFAMLALSAGLAFGVNGGSNGKLIAVAGLTAAAASWMVMILALRRSWEQRPWLGVALLAGLIALMAALVIVNPTFGFFSWTGYIWTFRLVQAERWRAVGITTTAAVTGTSQHGGLPNSTAGGWISWLAVVGINLLAVSVVSWFVRVREREADDRQQAIDELTEANEKLEASLRENAGLHAQLVAQAREAGVLDERQRMAREIHDTLAQGLVGIITQLEAATQAPRSDREWKRHTDAAVELARESLAEARRSVQALQPVPLKQARLPDALGAVARTWSERSGVPATVTPTGRPRPVGPDIEVALLRTAQEALANVAKHARAKRVGLTLSYMDDLVTLDVRDDGMGFAAPSPRLRNGGFGLTAMRQRVEGLAGSLEVESEPGAGTTVAASVPAATAA
jgi:signal transduction histidine kinase